MIRRDDGVAGAACRRDLARPCTSKSAGTERPALDEAPEALRTRSHVATLARFNLDAIVSRLQLANQRVHSDSSKKNGVTMILRSKAIPSYAVMCIAILALLLSGCGRDQAEKECDELSRAVFASSQHFTILKDENDPTDLRRKADECDVAAKKLGEANLHLQRPELVRLRGVMEKSYRDAGALHRELAAAVEAKDEATIKRIKGKENWMGVLQEKNARGQKPTQEAREYCPRHF
jgi:hypothetical protein